MSELDENNILFLSSCAGAAQPGTCQVDMPSLEVECVDLGLDFPGYKLYSLQFFRAFS